MRRCCELLAVALLLAPPATARADSRTRTSGATTATITWTAPPPGGAVGTDLHVTIRRAGVTLVDQPVATDEDGPALGPRDKGVRVADLDYDGEPEVVVDADTGGAHCCYVTTVWWFDGAGYQSARHDWGNVFYRLGGGLLVGQDDFSYAFSDNAGSRSPVLILDAHLRDVTAEHPRIVMHDLHHQRHFWARYHSRPAAAAYIADLHSLGRHAAADRVLRRFHGSFVRRLTAMLRDRGYMSRNSASAASTICGSCGNALCSSGCE